MNKIQGAILVVSIAGAAATATLAASHVVHASGPPPAGVRSAQPSSPTGTLHMSLGTVVNEGNGVDITVPSSTFTNTDQLTKIKCPQANGCAIIFRVWGQVAATSGQGLYALCPLVDDAQVPITCAFLGTASATGDIVSGTSFGIYLVPKGIHQVRTQVYMETPGLLDRYHYEYELTTS